MWRHKLNQDSLWILLRAPRRTAEGARANGGNIIRTFRYFVDYTRLLETFLKMDLYFLISAVLGMFSVVLSAGLAAPTEHPRDLSPTHSSGGGRVRTKRCSCATFLDKECVYFCHLDIIWVNTPERVVSYGLGNAPRRRRSVPGSRSTESTRCVCLQRDDRTCDHFCQPRTQEHREKSENMSSVHSPECSSSRCQQPPPLTSAQSGTQSILSPKLRAVVQTRTILEKWRMRRKERSRPQQLNLLKT